MVYATTLLGTRYVLKTQQLCIKAEDMIMNPARKWERQGGRMAC